MLQVAVSRLAARLPGASIRVFTDDPAELSRHCPGVEPADHAGGALWSAVDALVDPLRRVLPAPAWRVVARAQDRVRRRFPGAYVAALSAKERLRGRDAGPVRAFVDEIRAADFLVACGQGTLSDAGGGSSARLLLDTVAVAVHAGIPAAMLGQGVGPLADPDLLVHAGAILPHVALIGLREERRGWPLLRSLGVSAERIYSTGDDAIEPAYVARQERPGRSLGIHLRIAPLAAHAAARLDAIRTTLRWAAAAYGAPLVPLPISQHAIGANDASTIRRLLAGLDDASDGGAALDTPAKVIAAAGRCRIVVTGAYHAAVFALAQGIPAVCLGSSDYYLHKFDGLLDLFGTGVTVVRLDAPDLAAGLAAAIARAWEQADEFREPLLAAARRQIELGRALYDRVPGLVGRTIPVRPRRRRSDSRATPAAGGVR